jgi:hypothetical protein
VDTLPQPSGGQAPAGYLPSVGAEPAFDERDEMEVRREAATMTIYVAIVLMAELAAIPVDDLPRGWSLLVLVWGTTVGLALAHWFAFSVAAPAIGEGFLTRQDVRLGVAGVLGSMVVAVLVTGGVLLFSERDEDRFLLFVPAVVIGGAGYFVGRSRGSSHPRAAMWGLAIGLLGVIVATVKLALTH